MNELLAPTVAVAPSWVDVLPTRGGKRQAITWEPCAECAYTRLLGYAKIQGARDTTCYAVTLVPTPAAAPVTLLFSKVGGKGTDPTRDRYLVECERTNARRERYQDRCECTGFQRHGHCKHSDAARTLLLNRWLPESLTPDPNPNPEETGPCA